MIPAVGFLEPESLLGGLLTPFDEQNAIYFNFIMNLLCLFLSS